METKCMQCKQSMGDQFRIFIKVDLLPNRNIDTIHSNSFEDDLYLSIENKYSEGFCIHRGIKIVELLFDKNNGEPNTSMIEFVKRYYVIEGEEDNYKLKIYWSILSISL